jgi:crotonobetainyl-CoA:carnitine CoA-transferase CaiB-like acyl-CoA transferase
MENDLRHEKNPGSGPLRGIRVIDLTAVVSGPFATQTLGDMGADVVKVEPPEGDSQRRLGPALTQEMGPIFINSNRSKRSVALDLKRPAGRAALLDLVKTADVLMFNFRPSAMKRLGLAYEDLQVMNPRLVYVGISGFAEDGPYGGRPAYDDLIQAGTGLAHLVAIKNGGEPTYVPLAVADRITGLNAAIAVLGAIVERHNSGLGQHVDLPMFETLVGHVLADHLSGMSFEPPLDAGGYPRLLAKGRKPYATQDGYVAAMMLTDKQWRSFFALLGRESEFDTDPRLANMYTRNQHVDELYAEIEAVMATRPTSYWLEALERADVAVMPVHDLQSLMRDPHLVATHFFEMEEHPSQGTLRRTRYPIKWSRTPPAAHRRHAPRLGEHSVEVMRQVGYSETDIDALLESGALVAATPLVAEDGPLAP